MLSCSVGFSALYCCLSWDDQTEKGFKPIWVKAWRTGEDGTRRDSWVCRRAGVCGTQNNTGISLETAVLETSALLPFPRESMQLAVILCSQKIR